MKNWWVPCNQGRWCSILGVKASWRRQESHVGTQQRRNESEIGGCVQKRSDWAWTKQVLGLTGWRGEGPDSRMCFKCGATKDGPRSFRDTSASAGWRPTMIDTRTFIKTTLSAGKFLSVVFQWPGFQTLGLVLIQADLMHTGCLGVVQYVCGNILYELFLELGGVYSNPLQTMCILETYIRQASKAVGLKQSALSHLTIGMIKAEGRKAPKLKAKAAESRHVLKCVCHILETHHQPKTPYEELRYNCVKNLANFYDELCGWKPGISNTDATKYAHRHLIMYTELGRIHLKKADWQDNGWFMYRWYPKRHLFCHVVEDQIKSCDNPRDHWCYGDESFIGEMVTVAESVGPTVMHRSVITKYRL